MRESLCIALILASAASAGEIPSVPFVNIDPQQAAESQRLFAGLLPASDESWGWAFAVQRNRNERITVTHLAWYDTDGDGLSHPHSIGIWRDTVRSELGLGEDANVYWPQISENELVVEAIIPAGTVAESVGPWRRIAIEPILLAPGNYQVVGQNHADSGDDLVFWTQSTIPNEGTSISGTALNGLSAGQPEFGPIRWGGWLPEISDRPIRGAIMGPMLFVQSIIPEPSTSLLTIMACLAKMMFAVRARGVGRTI